MAARFGRALYWIFAVTAGILLLPIVLVGLLYVGAAPGELHPDSWMLVPAYAVLAAAAYGIGRVARYILAGE